MALQKLLEENPALQVISKTKVKCMYSGHEMPNNEEVVRAYINGKKYRSLLKQKLYDYESLHPYIVSSCRRSHQLYCRLTRRYINNIPEHVERHRSGKKFKRALQRYLKGEVKLWEEQPPPRDSEKHSSVPDKRASHKSFDDDDDDDDMWTPPSDRDGSNDGHGKENDDNGIGFNGKSSKFDESIDDQSDIEENDDDSDDSNIYASSESDEIMDSSNSVGFSQPHLSTIPFDTAEMKNSVGTGKGSMHHNGHFPGTGNVRKGKRMAAPTSLTESRELTRTKKKRLQKNFVPSRSRF